MAALGLGEGGKAAVPILKQGLDDPDDNIRAACKKAIESIEAAKETPEQRARLERDLAIVREINEFKAAK